MASSHQEQSAVRDGTPHKTCAKNMPVIDEDGASPEVRQLYQSFRDGFGRPHVPGILKCFATHPPLLEHMIGLAKQMLFTDGALGRQNKELISAFVSVSNGCAYCTDSHAHSFRLQGGTAAATRSVLNCDIASSDFTPQQQALLDFARKVTEDSNMISPRDIDTVRTAGFNDLQIAEAIHTAALFAAFNRVVNAFGLPSQQLLESFGDEESSHGR